MENTAILREWFERVDSNNTGSITAAQLKSALSVGNLEFSVSVVQQMIRMYDFDRNGTMSFEEFVALNKFLLKVQHAFADLESYKTSAAGILKEPVHFNMWNSIPQKKKKTVQIHCLSGEIDFPEFNSGGIEFHILQRTGSRGRGFLAPDDVYEALVKIGFSLDSPAFYTVCESFDQNKNGRFRLDDFISLSIFVQSARNLFNSFDTTKQGRVTLDLNQFIYCATNCRI